MWSEFIRCTFDTIYDLIHFRCHSGPSNLKFNIVLGLKNKQNISDMGQKWDSVTSLTYLLSLIQAHSIGHISNYVCIYHQYYKICILTGDYDNCGVMRSSLCLKLPGLWCKSICSYCIPFPWLLVNINCVFSKPLKNGRHWCLVGLPIIYSYLS